MSEASTNAGLSIASATGVDVALHVAGAGGRSYAFVIDWHIRALLALAWILFVMLLTRLGRGTGAASLLTWAPAAAIYFLYHPVLETVMRGRTPGKRMAGLKIVTREGATPGAGALLIRNLFRIIDSLPMFYCVGLGAVLLTQQHVRIGDLAAGTLLVYDDRQERRSMSAALEANTAALDRDAIELIDDVLLRWEELTPAARGSLGRDILRRLEPGAQEPTSDAAVRARLTALLHGPATDR